TARAGAGGVAISFCDNGERSLLRAIEKLTRQTLASTDRRAPGAEQEEEPQRRAPPQGLRPHGRIGAERTRNAQGRGHGRPKQSETAHAVDAPAKARQRRA